MPSARWQDALALPLLLVAIAFRALVRLLPVVDRLLGPVGGGAVATVGGLLLLLPECPVDRPDPPRHARPWGVTFT
ncbi:hypothetical protein [Dactylosporangium sp. NPDC050588]|uniref:hypothetical protein n=1 Tax=Dactylosporangium sp. NPDC050588 TaxID=3157211 RepID=UPI0033CC9E03